MKRVKEKVVKITSTKVRMDEKVKISFTKGKAKMVKTEIVEIGVKVVKILIIMEKEKVNLLGHQMVQKLED